MTKKKPTKSEQRTKARQTGTTLLINITRDLHTFRDMVYKREVYGVGCGDVDDAIAFIGRISNRVAMYSW